MSGSQKLILYVEIFLIVVGLGIFIFAPGKQLNLTNYYEEFNKLDKDYNLVSGLNYKLLANDLTNLISIHDEIKKTLEANDPKTDVDKLITNLNDYKRILETVKNNSKIYKVTMNKFAEAIEKIDKFSADNSANIKKFDDIRLKLNTSETLIKSLWESSKKATTLQELTSIQSKLSEQLGIIDSLPLLLSREEEKLKNKEASKYRALIGKKALEKKQAEERRKEKERQQMMARKKAEEKKKEEKIVTIKYSPPKLLKKVEPDYPERWRSNGVGGKVKLNLVVGANGHVKTVKLIRSTDNDILDKNAINAAKECLFIPAKEGDKPVESIYTIKYEFIAD